MNVKRFRGHTEVRVELQMDRWAVRGGSVRLRCLHDVPHHLLDKVVFLRHGTKIFQYIRDRKPPYRNFTTPGAVLNIALATENSIILQNLDFAASGTYSCEVSMDTPIYTKASSEKQLTVFQTSATAVNKVGWEESVVMESMCLIPYAASNDTTQFIQN
ncbi:hypothetical protein ACJJTC_011601 [Scirpophaga incertulas]